jgi:hypothetical protein
MRITQDNELRTGPDLERYVIYLLKEMQAGTCARIDCFELLSDGFQIAHKRYGVDITLYDLELLCPSCHAKDHNLKSCRGLVRQ